MAIETASQPKIAPQEGVLDRLSTRFRSRQLDQQLARGTPPETAAPLALRARRLTTLSRRRAIADSVRRVIRDTCRGCRPPGPRFRLAYLRSLPQSTTSPGSPTLSQALAPSPPAAWRRRGSCSPTAPARCTTRTARRTYGHALPPQPTTSASKTDGPSRPPIGGRNAFAPTPAGTSRGHGRRTGPSAPTPAAGVRMPLATSEASGCFSPSSAPDDCPAPQALGDCKRTGCALGHELRRCSTRSGSAVGS